MDWHLQGSGIFQVEDIHELTCYLFTRFRHCDFADSGSHLHQLRPHGKVCLKLDQLFLK